MPQWSHRQYIMRCVFGATREKSRVFLLYAFIVEALQALSNKIDYYIRGARVYHPTGLWIRRSIRTIERGLIHAFSLSLCIYVYFGWNISLYGSKLYRFFWLGWWTLARSAIWCLYLEICHAVVTIKYIGYKWK